MFCHYLLNKRVSIQCDNPAPMHNSIVIKGAREHNLKSIDVMIPRDQFVVITDWRGGEGVHSPNNVRPVTI